MIDLSPLSQKILDYVRAHPAGATNSALEVFITRPDGSRVPPIELEHARSALARKNFIRQRSPGTWILSKEGALHVEPEPEHARIRPTGKVSPRPDLAPDFPARAEARTYQERAPQPDPRVTDGLQALFSPRTHEARAMETNVKKPAVPATTQERTMAKKTRTCTECKKPKAPQAFKGDSEVCRFCKKGTTPKAATPKAARKPRATGKTKLRALVRKQLAKGSGPLDGAIATLEARKAELTAEIGKIDRALDALQKAA